MMLPIAILAGGLATRLGSITVDTPKSMIKINGTPFIDWQLRLLKLQSVTDVVICIGHLGNSIIDYVGDGGKWSLNVRYSIDGLKPLLTGGALKKALPLLGDNFFVIYGDSYLPINFSKVVDANRLSKKPLLMTVYKNNDNIEPSNVNLIDKDLIYSKRKIYNNFAYIDYGLSVIKSDTLKYYSDLNSFDLADFYEKNSLQNNIEPYVVSSRYYEIGSIKGIIDFENYIKLNETII